MNNFNKILKSDWFGGKYSNTIINPIKEQISVFKVDEDNKGGFYKLHNVQNKLGDPTFFDIWILVESIKDKELI